MALAPATHAGGPVERDGGDAARGDGHAKSPSPWTQSLRVETESGVFTLVPVEAHGVQAHHDQVFIAMWYPHTTGELFAYDRICGDTEDVVHAVQALARDFDVDPITVASADETLHRAFLAANDAKDDAAWRSATALGLGRLMGFEAIDHDAVIEPLYCPPGSQCHALAPQPPEPPSAPRNPRDLEAISKNFLPAETLLRIVQSHLEFACCCGPCGVPVGCPGGCDDGYPCTTDSCYSGICTHNANVTGPICFVGNNTCWEYRCFEGACTPYAQTGPACDHDNDPCITGHCVNGGCHADTVVTCPNDGLFCNGSELCTSPGGCGHSGNPCPPPGCGEQCSQSHCDESTDSCVECLNNGHCDDDVPCTQDVCNDNACQHITGCPSPDDCHGHGVCTSAGCAYDFLCDDGDPCTADFCNDGQCDTEPRYPAPSEILDCATYGCSWAPSLPAFIPVNNDDDDGNGIPDYQRDYPDPPAVGDDDLVEVSLALDGCPPNGTPGRGLFCETWSMPALVNWRIAAPGGCLDYAELAVFTPSPHQILCSPVYHDWPPPSEIHLEGHPSYPQDECGVPISLGLEYPPGFGCTCHLITAAVPVVRVDSLEWEKADPSNRDLDECPNNGGDRIFPDKLSPTDNSTNRNKVKLVATIEPPVEGVTVYFRLFDPDDPFDQLHGPNAAVTANVLPGVEVIDGNTSGLDNRPTGEPNFTRTATTDSNGVARTTITVSMQPGNNYRAAASLLQEAVQQQINQTKADELSVATTEINGQMKLYANGGFTGYKVPAVWSPMLTVWRTLHVEVDSMAPADATNRLTGTVQAAPTYNPTNQRAIVDIADLESDFEEIDHHQVGRLDIAGFGSFTTVATIISAGDDQVEIVNAPANIAGATGAAYTLWDDDAGSVPPFVMLAFDAPPVTLPKALDTGLMAQVFKNAYVKPLPPDAQYYDSTTPFDRNVADNSEAVASGQANRDLTSSGDYWAVHLTSAFQGYVVKDNDPDTEQAAAGLQYGLTGVRTFFGEPRAGSLIFLETIRDDKRGNPADMSLMERYTAAHEAGHQFLLEHEDDRWPLEDQQYPQEDYIMTDVLDDTGMAPNIAFSANSLNKIRSVVYPRQE